tara:strand:+ start:11484 stop:12776 length:1293 start_codon:yes stop_codon:yes gene_type:complete
MKKINFLKQLPKQSQKGTSGNNAGKTPNQSPANQSPTYSSPAAQNAAAGAVDMNAQVQQLALQLADQIVADQQQVNILSNSGKTFSRFNATEDIVDKQTQIVTAGLWSDNQGLLDTFYSSSAQTNSQRRYYVDVLQKSPQQTGSAVQFACAFGHVLGSGSSNMGNDDPASKAVYAQYKQLLLEQDASRFVTAGSGSTEYIYVVNVQRNRMKEQLDAGNWQLPLSTISSSRATNATGSVSLSGSAKTFTFIDDSSISSGTSTSSGKVFNVVSGSIDNGIHNPTNPVYYGLFYPKYGSIVLDGKMLDQDLGFATNTGSNSEGNNHFALFHSISGSFGANGQSFEARNQETITSTHYFVRVKNGNYNFSNNPSFTTGSVGEFTQTTFVGDPSTYITTIGLYNDSQELLAVAKLSKPLLKNFSKEALVRVKLDF